MMLDPAIRLFGRTIQLPQYDAVSGNPPSPPDALLLLLDSQQSSSDNASVSPQTLSDKSSTDGGGSVDMKLEHGSSSHTKSCSEDKGSEEEEEEEETSGKPLKKPTKILPCPRCNSTDTKFCYFNNYNVNQPRHFCKKCQRYWTAGGTMRSMLIGAGRRKNKSSSCLSHHIPFVAPEPTPPPLALGEDPQNAPTISFQSFAALWPNPPVAPPPGFVPVYAVPPPYWGCWMPNSPLGKHPREDDKAETKVLVPKTLRFDDPREAAQSSIWTTLGIKNDKGGGSLDSGAFFSGFQPKGGELNSARLSSRLLQANPAALSRSFAFHECV